MQSFTLLFLESIGTGELLVILLFVLMFFGSKKIPELARGLGKGMREMNDAMRG
ncbi:MAG: twin-arginine translocase TatA/TatE family subunit, partial [Bacteroidota bacterium]